MKRLQFFLLSFFLTLTVLAQTVQFSIPFTSPIDETSADADIDILVYDSGALWLTVDQAAVNKSIVGSNIIITGVNVVAGQSYVFTFAFRDEAGNVGPQGTATNHTVPPAVTELFTLDAANLSVGAYVPANGVTVFQGSVNIIDVSGVKKFSNTGGTLGVLNLGSNMPFIGSNTRIEVVFENIEFNSTPNNSVSFGAVGNTSGLFGLFSTTNLKFSLTTGGVTHYTPGATMAQNIIYPEIRFTAENEGSKIREKIFINGVESATFLTTEDTQLSDYNNIQNWAMFGRNTAGTLSSGGLDFEFSKFYIDTF